MAASPLNTLMPPSVFDLGNSLIAYIDRSNENNVEFPEVKEYHRELFSYPWDRLHTTILRQLLQVRTPREFYRLQYVTLFKVMEAGSAYFFCLLIKYGFLNTSVLNEYPVIKFVEGRSGRECFKTGRVYKCGTRDNCFWIFDPASHSKLLNQLLNYTCVSVKRMRKTIWGLVALALNTSNAPPYLKVQCIKIFYDLIREPYITRAEMEGIVTHIKGRIKDTELQKLLEAFDKYFPESSQNYQPRTLQHFCLCQVRDHLSNAGMLPHGIQKLNLPKSLEEDILPKVKDVPRDCPVFKYNGRDWFFDLECERNSPDTDWWVFY